MIIDSVNEKGISPKEITVYVKGEVLDSLGSYCNVWTFLQLAELHSVEFRGWM